MEKIAFLMIIIHGKCDREINDNKKLLGSNLTDEREKTSNRSLSKWMESCLAIYVLIMQMLCLRIATNKCAIIPVNFECRNRYLFMQIGASCSMQKDFSMDYNPQVSLKLWRATTKNLTTILYDRAPTDTRVMVNSFESLSSNHSPNYKVETNHNQHAI